MKYFLAAFLTGFLFSLVAQNSESTPSAKTDTATKKDAAAKTQNVAMPSDEMGVYRSILSRSVATRQDLYNLVSMQRGEFDKSTNDAARNKALQEKGVTIKEDTNEPATRGEVAKALLQTFDLEEGVLYRLTGWEFFALRDIQNENLMQNKFSFHQVLSGEQLIGVLNAAAEADEKKRSYGKAQVE